MTLTLFWGVQRGTEPLENSNQMCKHPALEASMKKSSPTIPFPNLDKLFEQEATQKGILDSNGVFLALTITKAFGEARVKVLFYGLKFYAIRLLCSFLWWYL